METLEKEKVRKVKQVITKKRIEIAEEIETVDAMGEESIPIMPEDLEVMYAGKLCIMCIKNNTASQNILKGYLRSYPDVSETTKTNLINMQGEFQKDFELAKTRTNKVAMAHPLYKKLGGIKGLSGYQLALIMSYIKNISRFENPSSLCVYAGVASIDGIAITKGNIKKIQEHRFETNGKEFKGFNTEFAGRMLGVVVDCLIRSKGFFYNYYLGIRKRLEARAITGGETFVATVEQQKESKGVMKAGHRYMVGKNNYSLIMWSDNNAKRRVCRTLLHLIHTEWRTLANLPVRIPYPIDYLGHNSLITLDEVLKADSVKSVKKRKDKSEGASEE